MNTLGARLNMVSPRWRWAALGVAVLVGALLAWVLFFRGSPSSPASPAAPVTPRPGLGKTITYQQYTAAVDSALADVRAARSLSGDEQKKKVQAAAGELESVEGAQITMPGVTQVNNTTIIAELRASSPNLQAVESSLAALAQTLGTGRGAGVVPGTSSGTQASDNLKSVLSDPAFNYEAHLTPLQRLARWLAQMTGQADPRDTIWKWVTSVFAALAAATIAYMASDRLHNRWVRLGIAAAVGLVVGLIFYLATQDLGTTAQILGAVGLLVAAIVVAIFASGAYRASMPAQVRPVSDLAAVLRMSAAEARGKAMEAAVEGDYRLAIRFRCLAVLIALDEAGKLVFDRASTNREYLFRAKGDLHDELQPLLDRFDVIWYGEAPATAAEWNDYAARAAHIEAEISPGAERRVRGAEYGAAG